MLLEAAVTNNLDRYRRGHGGHGGHSGHSGHQTKRPA